MSATFADVSPVPSTVPDSQEEFNESFMKALLLILNSYSQYLRYWSRCWDRGPECMKAIMGKFEADS